MRSGLRRSHTKSRNGCQQCKKRRVKCDEKPPRCGNCDRRQLRCDYESLELDYPEAPSIEFKPSLLRRSHAKSRNGCQQCKKSRIKCDEKPPCCGNCDRRQLRCDYEKLDYPEAPSVESKSTPQFGDRAKNTYVEPDNILLAQSKMNINLEHMELFHHYLTSTSFTLYDNDKDGQIWRTVVPQQALSNEYLMHAILAMSAVHIVHLRGPGSLTQSYIALAQTHHDRAVALFSSCVTEINPSNWIAAILFSNVHLIFSCGIMQVYDNKQPQDHIDSVVTILSTSRGYWTLLDSARSFAENGPPDEYWELIQNGSGLLVPDSVIESFTALEFSNEKSVADKKERSIYHETIGQLKGSLHDGFTFARVFRTLSTSDAYMELLRQKGQMALVILAYGCALSKHAPYRWFLQNWAADVTRSIRALVNPTWEAEMRWPLRELGMLDNEH